MSTVTITLHQSTTRWPIRRPQRWYWTAERGGNHKTMARSSGMYTNEAEAAEAAEILFGDQTDVILIRPGHASRALRRAL